MLSGMSLRGRSLRFAALAGAFVTAFALSGTASRAGDYPSRNIKLIVPSPPGGGTDTQARILAPTLGKILGQTIVIENRPGASGNIGAQAVSKASPDGYTMLAMISSHVINRSVLKNVPYNIYKFAMISRTVTVPGVLVGNPQKLKAKNLKELLAYLKANPGKVAFGSGGVGSLSQLVVELFEQETGVKMLHVPYRGTHPALNATLAGQVQLLVPDLTIALSQIKAGKLRAYGVTSAKRAPAAPNIPTLAEQGVKGFDAVQWFGLAAPPGTPAPIVKKLHDAVVKALNDPTVKARYAKLAMTPAPSASPAAFTKFVRAEGKRWAKVVKAAHITAK